MSLRNIKMAPKQEYIGQGRQKYFLLPLLFSRKKYDKSKNTEIVL